MLKLCLKCKKKKKLSEFYFLSGYYSSPCKECRKLQIKIRYNTYGKEIIRKYEYERARNPERKEKLKIYRMNWIINNPDKLKESKKKTNERKKLERHLRGLKPSGNQKGSHIHSEASKKMISIANTGNTYGCRKHTLEERIAKSLRSQGDKSHFWQGGRTSINAKIRNSLEYKLWREAVLKRDNWTCVVCNVRGGDLEADHIKQFAYFPSLRFDISNGRTLCEECHKTTDTYLNRSKLKETK